MDVGKLESFAKMVVNNATNLYILRGAAVDEVFFTMEHVYEFIGGHRVVLKRRSALPPLVDHGVSVLNLLRALTFLMHDCSWLTPLRNPGTCQRLLV